LYQRESPRVDPVRRHGEGIGDVVHHAGVGETIAESPVRDVGSSLLRGRRTGDEAIATVEARR